MSNLKTIEDKYKKAAGATGKLTFKKNDFAGTPLDDSFGVFLRDGLFANAPGNPAEVSIMPSSVPLIALTENNTRLVIRGQTNSLFVATLTDVEMVVTEANNKLLVDTTVSINTSTLVPADVLDWIKLVAMQFNLGMSWEVDAYKVRESKSGLFPLSGGTKLKMTFSRPGPHLWQLALEQSVDTPLTLADIGTLLNVGRRLEDSLPKSFKDSALGHLAVVALDARLNAKTKKIETFSLVCALAGKSWTLAPGLTLSEIQTTYTLTHVEGEDPALTAVFDGILSEQELSITAVFGSTAPWRATLKQTSVADLFNIFLQGRADAGDFFAGAALTNKLDITTLVYFKEHAEEDGTIKPAGSYHMLLGDESSVPIGGSLTIDKLGFLFRPEEGNPANTEVLFQGAMNLVLTGDGKESEYTVALEAKIPKSKQDGLRFSGELDADPGIPVGQLADFLAARVLQFNLPGGVEDFTIVHLGVSYAMTPGPASGNQPAKKTYELGYSCKGLLPLDGDLVLEPTIRIAYTKTEAIASMEVNGALELVLEEADEDTGIAGQSINLELFFASDSNDKSFTASLFIPKDKPVLLNKLVGFFDKDAGDAMPGLALPVPGFFLAYNKKKATASTGGSNSTQPPKGKVLLGARVLAGMKFSDLPMVGSALPRDQEIGVTDLMILYAGSDFLKEDVSAINNLLPEQLKAPVPQTVREGENTETKLCFAKGVQISGEAKLGSKELGLFIPLQGRSGRESRRTVRPAAESSDKPGQWFKVGKRLGPLYLSRVGFAFPESRLTLLLEAELTLGPLTLALFGFSVGSRLDEFAPVAGLDGFGLSFVKPPVEISAMFLKVGDDAPTGAPAGVVVKARFAGVAVIKTTKLSISAVGEYASTNRGPSFYLFAYIGYPLGGPAFFFVEGLALGFGFNRSVRLPEVSQIDRHPFVAIAMQENASLIELAEALIAGNYVPITPNSIFLALGIRFTTFKILDSFALVVATFGNSFRLDLMGMSKLVLPPGSKETGAPPLAEITLNLSASFVPDEGFFGMRAQLTRDSYILSRECTLQGGFAFYSWFKGVHEGDFVLTLGGYHPRYRKPAHYPDVPRLGFNWRVSSNLEIKGQMYFALTTTAVMAGGRLEAVWRDGNLKAWFIIGADFLISWKPYFYDIELYLQFGVSYTFWFFGRRTIKVELGADLHIWGPEFSGIARIDIEVVSFEVEFGAGAVLNTQALPWQEYRKSFLPERVLGMTIIEGLIRETEDGSWIVDPDRLVFEIESAVPSKSIKIETEKELAGSANIGAGAMLTKNITTGLQIDLDELEPANFTVAEIKKNVPAAVWGQLTSTKPATNPAQRLVPDVLSGARFTVNPPKPPNNIASISAEFLAFNEDDHPNGKKPGWRPDPAFRANATATGMNNEVLAAFGLSPSEAVLETDLATLDLTNADIVTGAY